MTDQTSTPRQAPLDGRQSAPQAPGGELPVRNGGSGSQAPSGGWTPFEARAFTAVGPAVQAAGQWLPLSARRAVARAVLAELKPELDALTEQLDELQQLADTRKRIARRRRDQLDQAEDALARVQALIADHPVAVGTHQLEAALDTGQPPAPDLRRFRAWLATELAKATAADRKTDCPPDLRISPHNGIAAGLSIALHGIDHLLGNGHDTATSPPEQIEAAIESEIYEYRERTTLWDETDGITEEIARLATRGALAALRHAAPAATQATETQETL